MGCLLAAGGVLYGLPRAWLAIGGWLAADGWPAAAAFFACLPPLVCLPACHCFRGLVVPKVSSGGVARVIAASWEPVNHYFGKTQLKSVLWIDMRTSRSMKGKSWG